MRQYASALRARGSETTPRNATPAVSEFIKKIAKRFPNHIFFTSSYITTKTMPVTPFPKNVGVLISTMDYQMRPGANEYISQKIYEWRKFTPRIYIWDYINDFDNYISPIPVLRDMQMRLRTYLDLGVLGVFLNGSGYEYSSFQEMNTSIFAALMMKPWLDLSDIVEGWLNRNMPTHASQIQNYFRVIDKKHLSSGKPLPMYGSAKDALRDYLDYDATKALFRELNRHGSRLGEILHQDRPKAAVEKEKALTERLRRELAYTLIEACRAQGYSDEWNNLPEYIECLKRVETKEEMTILLGGREPKNDETDFVTEGGIHLSDYIPQCEEWINEKRWDSNLLLGEHLTVTRGNNDGNLERQSVKMLTDGAEGFAMNYQWGWYVAPQKGFAVTVPPTEGTYIRAQFLNLPRHKISPPAKVVFTSGGKKYEMKMEPHMEGGTIIYSAEGDFSKGGTLKVTNPGGTRDLAVDEIIVW